MGTEAGNFHIIAKQVRVLGDFVDVSREELLLVVEAWAPRQVGPDLEVFSEAMAQHVGGMNPFRWIGVVGATCCMDVVIARPPSLEGRIDPSLHSEGGRMRVFTDD